jgi:flagellar biosynthesis protein FliR
MDPSYIITLAVTISLVIARLAGFMVFTPFPGGWVPIRIRAGLLISLAFTVGIAVSPPATTVGLDLGLVVLAASDFAVGLLIGGAFRFVLSATSFMAGLISQASWLRAPVSLSPDIGGKGGVLGHVATLFALLLAIGAGIHRIVIAYLLESFHILPVGSPALLPAAVPPYIDLVGRSFDVGMRLAFPVLAISLAVQSALGIISRVAPTLQIFSIGFAVLVASGLLTFMASLRAVAAGILQYLGILPRVLDEVLRVLGGG